MSIVDRIGVGVMGTIFAALIVGAVAACVADYKAGVRSKAFMSRCIEKWSADQCAVWDRYGRHDLAFRKDS